MHLKKLLLLHSFLLFIFVQENLGANKNDTPNEKFPVEWLESISADSSAWQADSTTVVVEVINSKTGETWMDQNLGASRVATHSADRDAYGHLFQWGRAADGHQVRTSQVTQVLSVTDQPVHGNFITVSEAPFDWRKQPNDQLWQGSKGINNPCPTGFRVPTASEWEAEMETWSRKDSYGAFTSALKIPAAGYKDFRSGFILREAAAGRYWSSTVSEDRALHLSFVTGNAYINSLGRSRGFSVRCIKE